MIHGRSPFQTEPEWIIDGQPLQISPNITYLGAVLGGSNGQPHANPGCIQHSVLSIPS